ncbi:MAG: filamentous hemagglutinin N-terminal domain-containing protein, partial [Bradyrhizobium sp.]|nr:filamentous hemagglutinin N-terminal domain-containing protein [Bradyrhizobium sp.]
MSASAPRHPRDRFRAVLRTSVSVAALLIASTHLTHAHPLGAAWQGSSAVAAAAAAAAAAAQQAQQAAQNSQQSMTRSLNVIRAIQAAQAAARAAADTNPDAVSSGLAPGGLVPDSGLAPTGGANPVTTWVGANKPMQTTGNGQTTVQIDQTQPTALLNWQSFNVSRDTTVVFNQQGNTSWSALNMVAAGIAPSRIEGAIRADGAIYIINQNGIIFSGTSQINVHTLIASTLNLSATLSANNYQQYLQNGLFSDNIPSGLTGAGAAGFGSSTGTGTVVVEAGAQIDTSGKLSANGDGGYVALLGGTGVSNAGTILTQNGQIILVSGGSITLLTPPSSVVGVQAALTVDGGGGAPISNAANALLIANDGAVTISGGQVNQLGAIAATTSTTRTASILIGNGNIVLGADSLTAILPDESSGTLLTSTLTNSTNLNGTINANYFATVLQPHITISGLTVDLQGHGAGLGGAFIKAPGAAVTINDGGTDNGSILFEPGSSVDVSGLAGVTLPMSLNQVNILVTQAEVADTPLAAALIGQTVSIDARLAGTRADGLAWFGSPILDAAGFVGNIPQTIDEILTAGGSVSTSAKNVVQMPGAAINISGGYVQYTGGVISTTRLLGADGRIYGIGSANPNVPIVGILTGFTVDHSHWGANLNEVFGNPMVASGHFEPGYIAGVSGGSLSVTAQVPVLEGDLVATVVAGDRQRALAGSSNIALWDTMPKGASLAINLNGGNAANSTLNVLLESQAAAGADPYGLASLASANVATWKPVLANGVFPIFTDVLTDEGLGSISIKGANTLNMATDAVLAVRPAGSITLDGVSTIDGTLSAPSGKITLTGFLFDYPLNLPLTPPVAAVVIGANGVLDVHGLWVNDAGLTLDEVQGSGFVNGGSVSITTLQAGFGSGGGVVDVTQSIVLAPGSVTDVSSGGYISRTGKLSTGSDGLPKAKGGNVSLVTYDPGPLGRQGADFGAPYNEAPQGTNPDGFPNLPNQANVIFGGSIYADGLDGGGTLTLQVPSVVIDGAASQVTTYVSSSTAAKLAGTAASSSASFAVSNADAGELLLPNSFFTSGFSQIALTNETGNVTVTSGTVVTPRQTNAILNGPLVAAPTGALLHNLATVGLLPLGLRASASLSLSSAAGLLIGAGAGIAADPQASVTLSGTATAEIGGSIVAPGGSISISSGTVQIDSTALLDVSGTFLPNPRIVRYSTGTVLDGGSITLAASGSTNDPGAIVVEPGARFDLRGAAVTAASHLIQLSPRDGGQDAWSDGGSLTLSPVRANAYFAGTVDAAGGAPLATGGSLTVGGTPVVIEPGGVVAAALAQGGVPSAPGSYLGADTLSNSGFDSVSLGSNVMFHGSLDVTIPGALTMVGQITLLPGGGGLLPVGVTDPTKDVPPSCSGCVPSLNGPTVNGPTVNLTAGYVQITGTTLASALAMPTLADGKLNVSAQWIDLEGGIAVDNAANVNLTSTGAIRLMTNGVIFAGALFVPGNLTLQAAEVYPVTGTEFLLASFGTIDKYNEIWIRPNGQRMAPLSAGGAVVLSAQTIEQDGTLWAPLGNIVLGTPSTMPDAITSFLEIGTKGAATFVTTNSVTLGTGSLTSVSAAGLAIPDGITVDDTTWYAGAPISSGTTTMPPILTAPPAKSISLFGNNVTTQSGAVLDLGGGGDIYATEFVAGDGGTRNVLLTYQQKLVVNNFSTFTPTYADGRQVYALVPTYEAKVAAYDPTFAEYPYNSGVTLPAGTNSGNDTALPNAIAPGQTVTIGAGSNVPPGTYVLLPGMYATLPGAYRVVQVASNINPGAESSTGADGSQYVVGHLGNAITGADTSQSELFQLQSQAVWSKESRIDITSAASFFRSQALAAGQTPPPLPIDGGTMVLGAVASLNLNGTNLFGPGTSPLVPGLLGGGGQVQIGGGNIAIVAQGLALPSDDCRVSSTSTCTHYLALDADQISNLGASSVLIGGTAQVTASVLNITATALKLEVDTDAAHPLTGPELLLVSLAGDKGITIDAGSVIGAKGSVPIGTDRDITIGADPVPVFDATTGKLTGYTAGVSGDGALIRVANGTTINVTRIFVPGLYTPPNTTPTATPPSGSTPTGAFSIGAGAVIDGGNALTLDTSGTGALASTAVLEATNYDIAGSVINIGGPPPSPVPSGIVLNSAVLANFNDAASVRLRSASVINLIDANGLTIGDINHPIGTLTFDSAGLFSQGGTTAIDALNVVLTNTQLTPKLANTLPNAPATGRLVINAGTDGATVFGQGSFTEAGGSVVLGNFSGGTDANGNAINGVVVHASQAIGFSGSGSLGTTFNIAGFTVSNPGSGYTSVPNVTITGAAGAGATATASLGVVSIAVTSGGSGYKYGDPVTVTGPGGSSFTGTAIVDASGAITAVNITASGSGFTGPITSVSVSSSSGTGANLIASLGVVGVNVTKTGSGYANATVTLSGGGGTGATAQAVAGGGANMLLSAPALVANSDATQALTTSGQVALQSGIGTMPVSIAGNIGGAVAITGATIMDSAIIRALSGNVTLEATSGDVVLNPGAAIDAMGSAVTVLDQTLYAPGGTVKLISDNGNVTMYAGSSIDVSAVGFGYAGSLGITTGNNGAATFNGTLNGTAAFNDLGGNFTLTAHGLAGALPMQSGFTGSFSATLANGDIVVPSNVTLASGNVMLTANAGSVIVDGTIDASGPSGGTIALYATGTTTTAAGAPGATGVIIDSTARLLARYQADNALDPAYGNGSSTLVQTGGTITLGTSGVGSTTSLNQNYGYENVTGSGSITVASGAVFDVSGGPGGANINNTGGTVIIRAPILTSNNVNVSFKGALVTDAGSNPSSGGIGLNAYVTWSTTDTSTGAQHFDGIIDPAGWFDGTGTMVNGIWQHVDSDVIAVTPTNGGSYFAASSPSVFMSTVGDNGTAISTTETKTSSATIGQLFEGLAGNASTGTGSGSNFFNDIVVLASNGGSGYTKAPTVTFTPPTGCTAGPTCTAATGHAIINSAGVVTDVIIDKPGSGYSTTPATLTFSGGTFGSGTQNAAAVNIKASTAGAGAALREQIVSVTVTTSDEAKLIGSFPSAVAAGNLGTSQSAALFAVSTVGEQPTTIATETGGVRSDSSIAGTFAPTTANANHVNFYQATLVGFVQTPFGANASNVAADFGDLSGSPLLHLRPEIDLTNPTTSINGGNITVVSNWNLGGSVNAGTTSSTTASTYQPSYRTLTPFDAGEPGVLSLRAVNNLIINATISDGFFETSDPFGGATIGGNYIANNPTMLNSASGVGLVADLNTTAAASLMSIVAGRNDGSFSYDFV